MYSTQATNQREGGEKKGEREREREREGEGAFSVLILGLQNQKPFEYTYTYKYMHVCTYVCMYVLHLLTRQDAHPMHIIPPTHFMYAVLNTSPRGDKLN